MPINSLYQLLSMVENRDPALELAETLLTIPDLLNYWLTGEKVCEFTNATTTQCYDPRLGNWAYPLLDCMRIPSKIFPQIVQPGTRLGVYEGVPVIAPASHDTGSAIAAVPARAQMKFDASQLLLKGILFTASGQYLTGIVWFYRRTRRTMEVAAPSQFLVQEGIKIPPGD